MSLTVSSNSSSPADEVVSPAASSSLEMSATDKIISVVFGPIRNLYCCCCGGSIRGRQFHNQDTGHGMGECCADRVLNHRPFGHEPMSLEEFQRTYGIAGVNYGVKE